MLKYFSPFLIQGLLALIQLVLSLRAEAQQPAYRHYSTEQGLPSTEVYEVGQDSRGFIWFMTDRGICRYNGLEFRTFTTDDGLCSNTIFGMREDQWGRIWFFSYFEGICYYQGGKFQIPEFNSELKKIVGKTIIVSLFVDEKKNIWLGMERGAPIRIDATGKIEVWAPGNGHTGEATFLIKETDDHSILVGKALMKETLSENHYVEIDERDSVLLKSEISQANSLGPIMNRGVSRKVNGSKSTFLLFRYGLLCIRDTGVCVFHFSPDERPLGGMSFDQSGDLWVGLERLGVYRFSQGDLTKRPQVFLHGHSVSCTYEDHETGIWFSTLDMGVFYMSNFLIRRVDSLEGRINSITANDEVGVFVGTYDKRLFRFTQSESGDGLTNTLFKNSIGEVISLNYYPSSGLFIGTRNRAFFDCFVNKNSDPITHVFNAEHIDVSKNNGVSFVGWSQIGRFHHHTREILSFNELNFSGKIVSSCLINKNTLLLGALDGLWRLNLIDRQFHFMGADHPLLASRVNDICIDSNGRLILATLERGVLIVEGKKITRIGTKEGLVSNQCNKLLIDPNGQIWVATNNGLSRISFDPKNLNKFTILNLNDGDGLPSRDIKDLAWYKGYIWLATGNGACYFNSMEKFVPVIPPIVRVQNFTIRGKPYLTDTEPVLSYTENDIIIHYQAISFRNPDKVRYRYMVEGLDTQFQYTSDRTIRLTNLAPGNYTFKVFACNSHGIWSPTPGILKLTILPPFWAKWWFWGVSGLVGMGIILGLLNFRIRQLKRNSRLMEDLHRSKLEALCAQMNPHFIFNSLSSIQNFLLKNDPVTSSQYLARVSSLMRLTLENSIQTVVPVEKDLEALRLYVELEQIRLRETFSFHLELDPLLNTIKTKIPPLLIQPIIENAIWHGIMPKETEGNIRVAISLQKDHLRCTVEDDGVGRLFHQNQRFVTNRGGSSGIRLTLGRLQAIANYYGRKNMVIGFGVEDLYDDTGKAVGTRVSFSIPLPKAEK